MPEGEEKEQETKNLFENIMKENFPNLAKLINSRKSRKLRESQTSWTHGSTQPRHSIITLPRMKEKERILKAAEERRQLPTREFP